MRDIQSYEVHVWITRTDLPSADIESLYQTLDSQEQTQAQRFKFPEHRSRYVASHGILRSILARYLEIEPSRVEFSHNDHGKPFLSCAQQLSFNMSHTETLVAVAVVENREIGIDLEQIQPMTEMDDISERHFTAAECETLHSTPVDSRLPLFYAFWARKEALLKAAGVGLSESLTDQDASSYWISDITVPAGYAGAVALKGGSAAIRYFDWNLSVETA